MCVLALGIGSTYTTEVKDTVTFEKSGKEVCNRAIFAARHETFVHDSAGPVASDILANSRLFGVCNPKLPLSHLMTGSPPPPSFAHIIVRLG